jgi:anti-sigma regulatory factor (Ser/Thr protein kinase)
LSAVLLPHAPASASLARRELVSELTSVGLPAELLDDAALVISELVGNAVRHARPALPGALEASWTIRARSLEVAVMDGGGDALPVASAATPDSIGGRGLAIVEALADCWGVRRSGNNIVVWAQLSIAADPALLARAAAEQQARAQAGVRRLVDLRAVRDSASLGTTL